MALKRKCKNNIKVLHLLLSLEVGGAERIVSTMIQRNRSDLFTYSVGCLDSIGSYGEALKSEGHSVMLLPRKPGIDWTIPCKLARLIHREGVDIIHAHGETPWFYGVLASTILCGRIKCVVTIHGYGGGDRVTLENTQLWKILTLFTYKVVVVSKSLLNELMNQSIIFQRNMTAIINGVDVSRIDSSIKQSRQQWFFTPDIKVLGIISRVSAIKNHKLLLRALKWLIEMEQNIKLVIVGDGPEKKSLEHLSQELGIQEAVMFAGERLDATGFFSLFDIFVLPSLSEGISMTILEAMASNTPVIASNVGGNNELITHGVNGFLFESEDLDGLVQIILQVLQHPEDARNAAQKSREKVECEYSFERMVSQYEEIYHAVIH